MRWKSHVQFLIGKAAVMPLTYIPPQIRFDGPNGGISKLRYGEDTKYFSEILPTLEFTKFDILEKYRKSFHGSELGSLYSVFPFESIAKETDLSKHRLGRRNSFSPSAPSLAYTRFSDRLLLEHLNRNIHYQLFCSIMINPSCPITNYKIINAIRKRFHSFLTLAPFRGFLPHTGSLILRIFRYV